MIRAFRSYFPRLYRCIDQLIPQLTHPVSRTNIHGLKFFLDTRNEKISHIPFGSGKYEPGETHMIQTLLKPGGVFLDIGANIGYFSCLAARAVGSSGQVFAFEPDWHNARILRKNVQINGFKQVQVENAAVGDNCCDLKLYVSEVNRTDHRMYDNGEGRSFYSVTCWALDEYFGEQQHIDLIKIDIQGFESLAFRGMQKLLARLASKVIILSEFFPQGLEEAGSNSAEMLALFHDCGMRTFLVDGTEVDVEAAEQACGELGYTNLVVAQDFPAELQSQTMAESIGAE